MQDARKTRKQLIAELQDLRSEAKELRAQLDVRDAYRTLSEAASLLPGQQHIPALARTLDGLGIGLSLVNDRMEIVAQNRSMHKWFPDILGPECPLSLIHI